MSTNDLDIRLKRWAGSHAPSDEHLNSLSRRIVTQAVEHRQTAQRPHPAISLGAAFQCAFAGAAAMLVACAVYMHMIRPGSKSNIEMPQACFSKVTTTDIDSVRKLYRETELLFADRLRWLSDSDGEVAMGIDSTAHGQSGACRPMMVRLTVVSRPTGGDKWTPLWKADILLHGQEVVDVAPNPKTDNRLALWVYELEDGKMAIDTQLSLDVPVQITSCINAVVSPGEPVEITTVKVNSREYRVFQTVVPLEIKG